MAATKTVYQPQDPLQPRHGIVTLFGYGITVRVKQFSEEALQVEEGSLYPALHRMEQAGWISAAWKPSENNRRAKYYRLTAKGRKRLGEEQANWTRVTEAVAKVLRFA